MARLTDAAEAPAAAGIGRILRMVVAWPHAPVDVSDPASWLRRSRTAGASPVRRVGPCGVGAQCVHQLTHLVHDRARHGRPRTQLWYLAPAAWLEAVRQCGATADDESGAAAPTLVTPVPRRAPLPPEVLVESAAAATPAPAPGPSSGTPASAASAAVIRGWPVASPAASAASSWARLTFVPSVDRIAGGGGRAPAGLAAAAADAAVAQLAAVLAASAAAVPPAEFAVLPHTVDAAELLLRLLLDPGLGRVLPTLLAAAELVLDSAAAAPGQLASLADRLTAAKWLHHEGVARWAPTTAIVSTAAAAAAVAAAAVAARSTPFGATPTLPPQPLLPPPLTAAAAPSCVAAPGYRLAWLRLSLLAALPSAPSAEQLRAQLATRWLGDVLGQLAQSATVAERVGPPPVAQVRRARARGAGGERGCELLTYGARFGSDEVPWSPAERPPDGARRGGRRRVADRRGAHAAAGARGCGRSGRRPGGDAAAADAGRQRRRRCGGLPCPAVRVVCHAAGPRAARQPGTGALARGRVGPSG